MKMNTLLSGHFMLQKYIEFDQGLHYLLISIQCLNEIHGNVSNQGTNCLQLNNFVRIWRRYGTSRVHVRTHPWLSLLSVL